VKYSLRSSRFALALIALASLSACIEWDRSTSHDITDIRLYVSGVQSVSGTQAVRHDGTAPAGGATAALSATIPALVLKGGAAQVTFTSATPFSRLIVAADGVSGYYELALGAAATSATVLIVYAQQVGAPSFQLMYAGGLTGTLGGYNGSPVAFLGNGTGEVQVNISWDSRADVDLYVVDPFGEEIYYAHRGSVSGGQLDIDSNAACGTDGPRAENIFWSFGEVPPRGDFVVRANYWSSCGEPATNYVVTIRTKDGVAVTYTGAFTGPGVGGAAGAGKHVAEFKY
jgi:hypothetical protein